MLSGPQKIMVNVHMSTLDQQVKKTEVTGTFSFCAQPPHNFLFCVFGPIISFVFPR
jgi:hypothetical protein